MKIKLNYIIKITMIYGVVGGIVSYIFFVIMQNYLKATDVQGFIWVGAITICATICACTGFLIESIKGIIQNSK